LDTRNQRVQLCIARLDEIQLIIQMPVNGGFHSFGTDPYALASGQSCHQPEDQPAIAPQGENPARLYTLLWHAVAE
jgi:hypothetical protein